MPKQIIKFSVKRCPECGQAWEVGGGGKDIHYGIDWPRIFKLQEKICLTCRNLK